MTLAERITAALDAELTLRGDFGLDDWRVVEVVQFVLDRVPGPLPTLAEPLITPHLSPKDWWGA